MTTKQALIHYTKMPKNDEFFTPPEAVYPLLKYLPKGITCWEPTDPGNSVISRLLEEHGCKVISTHKETGFDFLVDTPDFEFDLIVTNPPYSLKTEFLERAYELGKPFCFLLPIHTLEGVRRGKLFRKYGIQLIVLDRRINFMRDKKGVWFNTSWFCWKVLPRDLIFEQVK